MDVFAIAGLVLSGLSAILDTAGLAIPYWSYLSLGKSTVNSGLWSYCSSSGDVSACVTIATASGTLAGVRAMVVLGLLLMIGAVVCFLLQKFMMKDKVILTKVAAGLAILAGIFMLIGPVIYATSKELKVEGSSLHAGFALCIVAAVLGIAGGVCMFINKE
ncbi:uncharacterized protein LOC127860355 [Dreissena polymorpha]|uniref:uncharacterized protein LOC127860355 n=1 Tax=Dreissena polymorpha TaxID=45954 RepID=UPI0022645EAD|nr:uncharacterized protein LOC127860355 [Dreissena polymorpha]